MRNDKKNRKQHMTHRMAMRQVSNVLDKKLLKAEKLIIGILQNVSKQGANQKVNQDRKLSRCKRKKKKK